MSQYFLELSFVKAACLALKAVSYDLCPDELDVAVHKLFPHQAFQIGLDKVTVNIRLENTASRFMDV
jgi:hypothetical protein